MWWSILACALLAGCVDDRGEPTRFVGSIEGENTLVYVVRDPSQTNAYACDGTLSPGLFEWFATASADQLSITSDAGTATLAIDFASRSGTLTAGAARDFVFEPVEDGFGLYRGVETDGEDTYEVGIIVADDRTQNGAIGITTVGEPDTTVIVSPRIVPRQVSVRLLNDVAIRIENVLVSYTR